MTHAACESKLRSVGGHSCIYAQETEWQSGMWSCILPGLPTHLVQELNVGTVALSNIPLEGKLFVWWKPNRDVISV